MKDYKNLVPIVLVVLFLLGIYMKYDKNVSLLEEYNTYLSAARNYREMGITIDAETSYLEAIKLKPSIELYIEVGEFYKECVSPRNAAKWAKKMVEAYPEETAGYEYTLALYKEMNKYEDFFALYKTAQKRGLVSDTIMAYANELKAVYYFEGSYQDVGYYADGVVKVYDDGFWSYVNKNGKKVISFGFVEAGNFCGGIAPIVDKLGEIYFIDNKGNKKFVVQNLDNIVSIGSYIEELCTIYDGKTWGIYDLKGELKHGGYTNVSALGNGVIAVEKDGKWSLKNYEGELHIKDSFDGVKADEKGIVYRNERVFVQKEGKYYMIDLEGKQITKDAYEDVKIFNGDGYAAVKIDGKWGFIDKDGKVVIKPQYDDARSFTNGYAAVQKNQLWGFIDVNNEIFIDYMFSDARDFTDSGSVFVKIGKWKLLRLYSYN